MAETVHLKLTADGKVIEGESTQLSLGREKTIECVYFQQGVKTSREAGSAKALGRREHLPIFLRKRICQATPLLLKALTENAKLEAEFQFFRPSPAGDGTTEQFYSITLKEARVATYKLTSPDVLSPTATAEPPLEEIEFVFGEIVWTWKPSGLEHQDSWASGK
jgi:type VI secretion system secreted protein Hcp